MDKELWRKNQRKPHGCDCRRKTHGNPKVGNGMCHADRSTITVRIEGNRLTRRLTKLVRGMNQDDLEDLE